MSQLQENNINIPIDFDTSLPILLEKLIKEKKYSEALESLDDNKYSVSLQNNCSDVFTTVIKYLTESTFTNDPAEYYGCEQILTEVSRRTNPEETLLELLEVIETTKSYNLFVSILKSLQICLLRQRKDKCRSLEWCLNSIHSFVVEQKVPALFKRWMDEENEKLMEEDESIKRFLSVYVTVSYFYDPIVKEVSTEPSTEVFNNNSLTRRNVLSCFLLQLLGEPLAFLNLAESDDKSLANTYSRQCAATIVKNLALLLVDPFYLLKYVEKRFRWPIKQSLRDGVYENAPKDIFLMEEKIPTTATCIFYYLILGENLMPQNVPVVYSKMYLLEMNLYLATALLKTEESSMHAKAIKLISVLLSEFQVSDIFDYQKLELDCYSDFSETLSRVITHTQAKRVGKQGILLLKRYILQFDDSGQHFLLVNLFNTVKHNGLYGFLITLYKEMMETKLVSPENQLPIYFCGPKFEDILLRKICRLKNGVETDMLENTDSIISALNFIRYISIRDSHNRTSFWNHTNELEKEFLQPLRTGINMSRAHYKVEQERVKAGGDGKTGDPTETKISILGSEEASESFNVTSKGYKLNVLATALTTFDLIESLLARVTECLSNNKM